VLVCVCSGCLECEGIQLSYMRISELNCPRVIWLRRHRCVCKNFISVVSLWCSPFLLYCVPLCALFALVLATGSAFVSTRFNTITDPTQYYR
jgi:hypothetical protein